jgi:uncharacterized membrane protein
MKSSDHTLLIATGIGALTGVRSVAALSVISRHLNMRSPRYSRGLTGLLASNVAASGLTVAAAGEMVGDKLPFVPPRTRPAPLIGRAAFAALGCAAVARSRGTSVASAAVIGAIAAVGSAALATNLRRVVTTHLRVPDFLVGLAEDGIVVSGCGWLAEALE